MNHAFPYLRVLVISLLMLPAVLVSSGCSDSSDQAVPAGTSTGPAADLSEEIAGANPAFIGTPVPAQLTGFGYVEHEYVAAGTAVSYRPATALTGDGRWDFEPQDSADYRTRVLVRRPIDPARFSGTVVVEWLNVSGGVDADVQWNELEEELTRAGHAWVGVSAQLIGVEGGPVLVTAPGGEGIAGEGLKKIDPERYATLVHPGDGFSFDIFTQVARALREGGPALGYRVPEYLIAAGQSQSAAAMVTYYNGVQPLARAFDGFLVTSRGAGVLPLVGAGKYADFTSTFLVESARFRPGLDTPLLDVQAENDVIGLLDSIAVRQPDSAVFRLWEVAGTAHADTRLTGPVAADFNCGLPINDGPAHFVVKAGLASLENWLRTGEAPPVAPRLDATSGDAPELLRDADGIARGGIRTPLVDVPVDVLSGIAGPNPDVICILSGSTRPLSAERLAELYPTREDYLQRYTAATDAVIAAGFVLEADRQAMLARAQPDRIPE
jgi:hypothetical protein